MTNTDEKVKLVKFGACECLLDYVIQSCEKEGTHNQDDAVFYEICKIERELIKKLVISDPNVKLDDDDDGLTAIPYEGFDNLISIYNKLSTVKSDEVEKESDTNGD